MYESAWKLFSSVQLIRSVMSDSATSWTAAHQASLSITNSQVYSNSGLSRQWCHPTISSSVIPFPSRLRASWLIINWPGQVTRDERKGPSCCHSPSPLCLWLQETLPAFNAPCTKKVTIPLPSPQYIWLKDSGNPFCPLSVLWSVKLLPAELMGLSSVKPAPGRVNHPPSAFYLLEQFLLWGIKLF